MTKAKICHISTVHGDEDIRIFHKECRSLAAAGYDVTYLNGGSHDETVHGVRRLGYGRSYKNKIARMILGTQRLFKVALDLDADIYHIHDSELLRYAGKLKMAGKKVIYDSHEHLPMQILEKEWLPEFIRPVVSRIVGRHELKAVRNADLILAVADKTVERFANCGVPVLKIENFPIFGEFRDISIDYGLKTGKKKICYTGAVWNERGFDTMCVAAAMVPECIFIIAGRIDHPDPKGFIRNTGSNIEYAGYLSRKDVASLYEESIAGVCLFKPYPNNMIDPPTKIFEYMAAGIPVIASNFDSITYIVEDYDCGICVDPLDTAAISEAIRFMIDNPSKAEEMGKRGREAVEEIFNWEIHSQMLVGAYDELTEINND